jgi:heavy metal translocating P-type ATPase
VEWLFLMGIVGALGASVHASVTGRGAIYYEVVAVLLTVYTAGKALMASARSRALAESQRFAGMFSEAEVAVGEGLFEVRRVGEVVVGDRVRVLAGGAIPVDGRVWRGMALVRETPITGEAMPVCRREGDAVYAGSLSEDGELLVEATVPGGRRKLDELLARTDAARMGLDETRVRGMTDRITAWFLPGVMLVALGTWMGWAWQGRAGDGLYHGLSVLLVACPCALGLAAPLAFWNALTLLAAEGVRVRSAAALERLGLVDQVCFDKTGTLTDAEPVLVDFVTRGGAVERRRWMAWVAQLERRSSHPLARAFQRIEIDAADVVEVQDFRVHAGRGIEAVLVGAGGGKSMMRVGRMEWVRDRGEVGGDGAAGVTSGTGGGDEADWAGGMGAGVESDARVGVAVDGELKAVAVLREALRPGWSGVVKRLERLGCRVEILSGDRMERVERLGEGGSVRLSAGLSPTEKADRIGELQRSGRTVLFVGDGINDAPALATASVGMAVGTGSDLARATADAEWVGGDVGQVVRAVELARGVRGVVTGSLWFAGVYNLGAMLLAAVGVLHPVTAALLMVGSSVVVSWRSVRMDGAMCGGEEEMGWVVRWGWAGTFLVQAIMGSWLGALPVAGWIGVGMFQATCAALVLTGAGRSVVTTMTLAMLGPGNLGMLVGWWVDAGFGPVMREGVCLCCQSHHYFELGKGVPWMHVGMLAAGLPAMWGYLPRWRGWLGRGPGAVLASVGMLVGMNWGGDVVLGWAGPGHPLQFVAAWVGMSVGMLAGMGLGCGVAAVVGRGR